MLLLCILGCLFRGSSAVSPRPNVVVVLADDMGWGDWSRTGGFASTPHLEKMSRSAHARMGVVPPLLLRQPHLLAHAGVAPDWARPRTYVHLRRGAANAVPGGCWRVQGLLLLARQRDARLWGGRRRRGKSRRWKQQ